MASESSQDAAAVFDPLRPSLVRVAYRMLGSVADAEDVVQDAFLRWREVDRAAVAEPRAYLARVVSRLCLDRMKSARAQRETYVGTWLPEPVVGEESLADDLSVALLMVLERLSPLERAAFLLHDVFDMDYGAIAGVLERSEPACRQLAARARDHVRDERPRFEASDEASERLHRELHAAMVSGDLGGIARLLADDAVFYSDGGGKKLAALNPIFGKDKIMRFFEGISTKRSLPTEIEPVHINGLPGFVVRSEEGVETIAFAIAGDRVAAIYAIRNPDKLRHLAH
jgi:RNA polymerase sigma-70 factor, ECF subfamily